VTGARLLVIGLDGFSHHLGIRLGSQGRLPALRGLERRGWMAPLRSCVPPVTMPAWSSILTGVNPGGHGLFDFLHREPGRYELGFTHGGMRARPGFMELVSAAGGRVVQLLVPGTWPPRPLNGVVVSGFDSPVALRVGRQACHPPAIHDQLQRRVGGLAYAGFGERPDGPDWHQRALASMLREIARKEQACRWLLGRERWDAFMIVFGESDTAGHHLWRFHDPDSPRHPEHCDPVLRGGLQRIYERLDRSVERLVAWARPDQVCVLSDHGMGGAGRQALYLNRFLEERGWLRFRGAGSRGPSPSARVRRWALDRLPPELQARLFRGLPRSVVDGIETRSRYERIDFPRTRAFSDELSYAATIHLNLRGREPRGVVEDREAALEALEQDLLSWRAAGRPVVARVHRREDLFSGPLVSRAPDLVLELQERDGYSSTPLPSGEVEAGTTWRWLEDHELSGGRARGMNGAHRRDGVLLLAGDGVGPRPLCHEPRLEDVAPTLLSLLGFQPPAWMEGRPLVPAPGPGRGLPLAGFAPSEAPVADWWGLRQRLRSLGYLEGAGRP
jgi:predicted AlkP superfamily phosphohydrolase/phosphomutase